MACAAQSPPVYTTEARLNRAMREAPSERQSKGAAMSEPYEPPPERPSAPREHRSTIDSYKAQLKRYRLEDLPPDTPDGDTLQVDHCPGVIWVWAGKQPPRSIEHRQAVKELCQELRGQSGTMLSR